MWRSSCSLIIGSMVGVGCLSAVASGGVSFVSQDRRVEAAAYNGDEPGTKVKSATGFGPFHATVHADFLDRAVPAEPEGSAADATQDSTIGPSLLHTFSSVAASEQDASAFAISTYIVTFDLSTNSPYHVHERLGSKDFGGVEVEGGARLRHNGPSGGLVFDLPLEGDSQDHTFTGTASGQLEPGRYYFEASADARGGPSSQGNGTFSADLTLGNAVAVPLPPAAAGGAVRHCARARAVGRAPRMERTARPTVSLSGTDTLTRPPSARSGVRASPLWTARAEPGAARPAIRRFPSSGFTTPQLIPRRSAAAHRPGEPIPLACCSPPLWR